MRNNKEVYRLIDAAYHESQRAPVEHGLEQVFEFERLILAAFPVPTADAPRAEVRMHVHLLKEVWMKEVAARMKIKADAHRRAQKSKGARA